ncbi:hypothetical protein G436_2375 [Leptospira interrogans serovar Hardjo str. Norma]|uniref:Uncharacterized protein n=1 Tax=Leptospira interrogans serovar Hardjo str. Norma TaxID=1279460 RepID=A0A0M3TLR6_LEPIR|nr:hypothetical protein G436_2375 [Leptospira interrogans serovar Hardjo str. Norma]
MAKRIVFRVLLRARSSGGVSPGVANDTRQKFGLSGVGAP